jgi:hypothetical protein
MIDCHLKTEFRAEFTEIPAEFFFKIAKHSSTEFLIKN